MSGLVCLLPHGYEGQGPGAFLRRLERYLQLCAEDNMQVANCTTPANLLPHPAPPDPPRFPQAAGDHDDAEVAAARHKRRLASSTRWGRAPRSTASSGTTRRCAPEGESSRKDDKIRRVVLCSGKVYYDLYEEREKRGIDDVYLLRVEQLYPFR